MALTPILGITQVATNQSNKEATINDAILALEGAANGTLELDYTDLSGSYTISELQFARNFLFKTTNSPDGVLAISVNVPRTLNAHAVQRIFVVKNASTAVLTLTIAGASAGTTGAVGLVLPEGSSRLVAMDGDELFIASEATTVSRFIDLGDVPGTYEGSAGKTFRINADETGLELVDGLSVAELSDTDASSAADGSILRYNSNSQTWVATPLSLINTFLGLSDTPNSFTGMAGYLMQVNASANAISFVNPATLGGPVTGGGDTGQVLTKNSATDGDYGWTDPAVALPAGGLVGQFLKKNSNEEGDAVWASLPEAEEELPSGGSAGQILAKASNQDGDVEWVPVTILQEAQYEPAIVNAVAVSELNGTRFILPFTPTVGNALVVGYFSNTALTVATGWTALSALAANSWWSGAKTFARIVQQGDSTTIVPCNVGTADAAIVFEVDMRYLSAGLTGMGVAMGYADETIPQIVCDGATVIAAGVVNRAGSPTTFTVADTDSNTVELLDTNGGGNRFAGGIYIDPAANGLDPVIAFDMGGGTSGAYFYLTFAAIGVALEEAPTDGKIYVRRNKVWQVQGPALPTGGSASQILAKSSATDGDAAWVDAPAGMPVGGTQGQVVVKNSATPADYGWATRGFAPSGGTTGQVLTKASNSAFDFTWTAKPLALPTGGSQGQILVKSSATDGSAAWVDQPHDLPTGGSAGQYLIKQDGTNYAVGWADGPSGVPVGGTQGQVLSKSSDANGDVLWTDAPSGIPDGGSVGQMLQKSGEQDGDIAWMDTPVGLPNGGTVGQVLAKFTQDNGDATWVDAGVAEAPRDNTLYARINGGWQAFSPDDGTGGSTGGAQIVRPHRYWRISITGNGGNTTLALSELVLRTETDGPDRATGGSPFGTLNPTASAFDQIETTEASDTTTTGTIGYDFGVSSVKGIMEVQVWGPTDPTMAPSGFVVQYSDDGASWSTAWSVSDQTDWTAREKRTFTNPSPDYVAGNYTLEAPTDSKRYVRKNGTWVEEGDTLPSGGDTNQILTKNSSSDGDAVWADAPKGIPDGGSVGQVLAKATDVDKDVAWQSLVKQFTGLTDAPDSYEGASGYLVAVNSAGDGVEFIEQQSATPEYPAMTGNAGKVLTVNSEATDVEWKAAPSGLPDGGEQGQVLTKSSASNGDAAWADVSGLPEGGTAGQVLTKSSATDGDAQWETPNVALDGPGAFRFWRVMITAGNGSCSIASLAFRAAIDGADQAAGSGGTASQSSYYSSTYDGAKAFDANAATWWQASAATYPQWLSYQFPSAVEVREIAISSRNDSGYAQGPTRGTVQYSVDGVTWLQAFTFETTDDWASAETRVFTASYAGTVEEAPVDGLTYGRKDGAWTEVVAGAGGSGRRFSGVSVYRASGSSYTVPATSNSFTKIVPCDTVEYDTDGFWDSSEKCFRIPVGVRKVQVSAAFKVDNSDVFSNAAFGFQVVRDGSGAGIRGNWAVQDTGYNNPGINIITPVLDVVEGDLIPLYAATSASGALSSGQDVCGMQLVVHDGAVLGMPDDAEDTENVAVSIVQSVDSGVSGAVSSVTLPEIPTAGNWLVAMISGQNGLTTAEGWNRLNYVVDSDGRLHTGVFIKEVTATDAQAQAPISGDSSYGVLSIYEIDTQGNDLAGLISAADVQVGQGGGQDTAALNGIELAEGGEFFGLLQAVGRYEQTKIVVDSAWLQDNAGSGNSRTYQRAHRDTFEVAAGTFPAPAAIDGYWEYALTTVLIKTSVVKSSGTLPDLTGNAGKVLAVNANANGVEWVDRDKAGWTISATGTGAAQTIDLGVSVKSAASAVVFVNGIRYTASEYVVDGSQISLTTNAAGDSIEIIGVDVVSAVAVGGHVFSMNNTNSSTSSTTGAQKGQVITVLNNLKLTKIMAAATIVAGYEYVATVARLDSDNATVLEVLSRSPKVIANDSTALMLELDSPVLLVPGNKYAVMVGCNSAGDTYAFPIKGSSSSSGSQYYQSLPVEQVGYLKYSSIQEILAGAVLDFTANISYAIGLMGHVLP